MDGLLSDLLIRDVELDGSLTDVRVADGKIAEIGSGLSQGGPVLEGRGGALIPGLIDHHIHLLATAAARESVSLADIVDPLDLATRLRVPGSGWLRATGYHEHLCGPLDRDALDRIAPDRPVRVQHQTGSVWFLNSAAFALLDLAGAPPGVDATRGRIERADDWLRRQIGQTTPDLAPVGRALAALGVTGLCDATVTNDEGTIAAFAAAQARGDLPQRVMVMSGGPLSQLEGRLAIGPVKIVLDDHNLPPLEHITEIIGRARDMRRVVAVHCVTAGELALTLAAFETTGARPGDRIEHGGVIPFDAIPAIAALGLTVVTQSAFPWQRGDRYLALVDAHEQTDLYRCATLRRAGIRVAGSSDAPYATFDPWAAMRAAVARRTASGAPIGLDEAIASRDALDLYLGDFGDPGGQRRRIEIGAVADLCLLNRRLVEALATLASDLVAVTIVAGRIVFGDRDAVEADHRETLAKATDFCEGRAQTGTQLT